MKIAGLFAGIGGLESGLERAGHNIVFQCEIDEAACMVLQEHFRGIPIVRDIRKIKHIPSDVDLVAAGFPCQDLSQAGKTKGIRGTQSVLIEEVFRLLAKQDIPHVILENVSFMLHLNKGQAMHHVIGRMEKLGYSWAYRVLDTRSFGLPQRRERVFIVASKVAEPWKRMFAEDHPQAEERNHQGKACGFYWTEGFRGLGWAVDSIPPLKGGSTLGIASPPAIWMPDGRIVTPDIRDAERLQGFAPDWTKPAEIVERPGYRWKLVGNAVTVQVAEWLGRTVERELAWEPFIPVSLPRQGKWPQAAYGNSRIGRFQADVSPFPLKVQRRHLA